MPQLVGLDLVRNRRSWSNDAHVAQQDVEQLRHFVETGLPQKFPNARDTRIGEEFVSGFLIVSEIRLRTSRDKRALILAMQFGIGVRDHRPKLVEQKESTIHADAFLCVENRSA